MDYSYVFAKSEAKNSTRFVDKLSGASSFFSCFLSFDNKREENPQILE